MLTRPTLEQVKAARRYWRPKLEEVSEQCASCPFREDVGPFHNVLKLVAKANGHPEPDRARAEYAALQVKLEDAVHGDFLCHLTVYKPDYSDMRPVAERQQCKGASAWYRAGGDLEEA